MPVDPNTIDPYSEYAEGKRAEVGYRADLMPYQLQRDPNILQMEKQ